MSAATFDGETASDAPAQSETHVGTIKGLFRSITSLAATLVGIAHTRLELLKTELQEEVQHAAGLAVWALVALLALMIGLVFVGFTVVLVFWDTHRILAASLVSAVFILIAAGSVGLLIAKANSHPRFLSATLNELAKDAHALTVSSQSQS